MNRLLTFILLSAPAFALGDPTITSLSPSSTTAGSPAFTLTVNGTNFMAAAVVFFDGLSKPTTFVSATQLTVLIQATDVAFGGVSHTVMVSNTGAMSNSQLLTVDPPDPTISSLSPPSTSAGSQPFTLTINGTNFVAGAVVYFDGVSKTTTFVGTSQLTIPILITDVAQGGINRTVTVSELGVMSNSQTFKVDPPGPTITSFSPPSTCAGSAPFMLTINGTNFVAGAVVHFDGLSKTTTFVSASQLTIPVLAPEVASGGVGHTVTVAELGVLSASQAFMVDTNPTITSLSPPSTTAGSPPFTLTINGRSFVAGAVAYFDGLSKATTFVSASQLTIPILATDVAYGGISHTVVVSELGVMSSPQAFTVDPPDPTITSLSPPSATAGSQPFTLTISGTNFVDGAVVFFDGLSRATTFVNASQLTIPILAADVAVGGVNHTVTVWELGVLSASQTFPVDSPNPAITSLSPPSTSAGSPPFTLTVNGTNFVDGSVVSFDGLRKATAFVNASQLTVPILEADVAIGSVSHTVTVSEPGALSTSQNFPVITSTVATPRFGPVGGTYAAGQFVRLTSTTGATIVYTTDGTTPSASNGTLYSPSAPIAVNISQTIRAMAYRNGWTESPSVAAAYTINPAMAGYRYSRSIVIDHTQVPNVDQADFPLLFSGKYSSLASAGHRGNVQSRSGYDIIFASDAAGEFRLEHQIGSYDPVTGTINAWVRIPALSHSTDTTIYMFYGNPSITSSQENIAGVWDSNYQAVWHLDEARGQHLDSSANRNNSDSVNVVLQGTGGMIGGGDTFGGASSYVSVPRTAANLKQPFGALTFSAWVHPTASHWYGSYGPTVLSNGGAWAFRIDGGYFSSDLPSITGNTKAASPLPLNTWTHVVATYDGSYVRIFQNGTNVASLPATGMIGATPNACLFIGNEPSGCVPAGPDLLFPGSIDEVRISNVARSADWIAAEYNNQSSRTPFYSVGCEVLIAPAADYQFWGAFESDGRYGAAPGGCDGHSGPGSPVRPDRP